MQMAAGLRPVVIHLNVGIICEILGCSMSSQGHDAVLIRSFEQASND